ncbi:hypothetical protein SELMODRAFT_99477 [Selaginella moellendorffii]|uniref:Glutaredoxin-like protein n=1 Tax=Selaginella moellendorffii TaxID=88036 RepID=D8RRI1_SELML|nr:uncharacterized protein LOC9642366 [Selaginella moellendorffii]EFJ25247.1 hypothetical protein SELMODRAFT_99477 [Selaginella moellendorffii]|eukprot:XP_002973587.1 uncharacterized protein LOC9642366 [Selaginella moellendorffii]
MAGLSSRLPQWAFPRAVSSAAATHRNRRLVLYSKPGCCLCDGLKEKLQAAFLIGGDASSLAGTTLEVRDITSNPEWEKAYQYEIPVLARIKDDGLEEVLPRMSMRISVEQLHKKMGALLDDS